jgi:hypothetical protein
VTVTHRRAFLKQLGLERLPRPDAGDASLSDLRDSYLLSPDIILAGERKLHSIELVANSY